MSRKLQAVYLLGFTFLVLGIACSSTVGAPSSTPLPEPTNTATPVPTATPIPEPPNTATPEPTVTSEPTEIPTPEPTAEIQALFRYSRAKQQLLAGFYDEAITSYTLVIRLLPDFALGYHGRGKAFYLNENPVIQLALEDYNTAIELDPEFGEAYKDRAILYESQGDIEDAIADLEMAISLYHPERQAARLLEAQFLLQNYSN